MELMDIVLGRRSVRKYALEEIPEDKLEKILLAGLLAPSSRNQKPCEFYVIRDRDLLRKLSAVKSAGAGMLPGCGAAIAVFADGEKADTWAEDCSIALSFMMLMAQEQGIGSCWVQIHLRTDTAGADAEENVRRLLSVPDRYRIAGILSLGVPAEQPAAHTPDEADRKKIHLIG